MRIITIISYSILFFCLMNSVNSLNCQVGKTTYLNCKSCSSYGCKTCLDGYYKKNPYTCTLCPFGPCTRCYNENICTKCEDGFMRLRYDLENIKCVMLDDRMNVDNCSMYNSENNQLKCIDCIKGYKMDFEKNICVKRKSSDKSIDVDALF